MTLVPVTKDAVPRKCHLFQWSTAALDEKAWGTRSSNWETEGISSFCLT